MIKDSGNRREFETGALRDIEEGKGRCDLLPLDVCGYLFRFSEEFKPTEKMSILSEFDAFRTDGEYKHFSNIIMLWHYDKHKICNKKVLAETFLELSKHFEEGAKKYGEDNWRKGLPVSCYMNSAIRHYLKTLAEWDDEPHERAFIWNLVCGVWTMIKKPELNDIAQKKA